MLARDSRLQKIDALASQYLEQSRAMTYADLCARQDPPFGSVAFGAAGLVQFFCRAARERKDDALLEDAGRWMGWVERAPEDAFRLPGLSARRTESSVYCGPDGAAFVRVLAAHARGERYDRAAQAFARRCRALDRAPSEVLLGAAGYLAAAQLLIRETGDERFVRASEDVVRVLVKGRRSWSTMDGRGYAHGRAGILSVLLRWRRSGEGGEARRALEAEVTAVATASLGRLATEEEEAPEEDAGMLPLTWCNGAGGKALLWAEAYAWKKDTRFLALARACGRRLRTGIRGTGVDLCCGHAGRGFAFLALEGIDPERGWREAALDAGARATRVGTLWPNGLLKGYPGVAMLAWELRREGGARAPIG